MKQGKEGKQPPLTQCVAPRDRAWHPPAYAPDYKTTILRSPKHALVSIPQSMSELTGPDFSQLKMDRFDNDLLRNFDHGGLPIGERIIMHGYMFDQYGHPVPNVLIEIWQANAGGSYRHKKDHYIAPLDPNFCGVGRTLTDQDGHYVFRTIKPGPYPWPNGPNTWRPSHIHVSILGPTLATRLITQMYFEGDPLIALCPIVNTIKNQHAIETLISQLDMATSNSKDCLAYRFDIIVRGQQQTYFENK